MPQSIRLDTLAQGRLRKITPNNNKKKQERSINRIFAVHKLKSTLITSNYVNAPRGIQYIDFQNNYRSKSEPAYLAQQHIYKIHTTPMKSNNKRMRETSQADSPVLPLNNFRKWCEALAGSGIAGPVAQNGTKHKTQSQGRNITAANRSDEQRSIL